MHACGITSDTRDTFQDEGEPQPLTLPVLKGTVILSTVERPCLRASFSV